MTTQERIIAFVREDPHSDSVDIGLGLRPTAIEHVLKRLADMVDDGILIQRESGIRRWYEIGNTTGAGGVGEQ